MIDTSSSTIEPVSGLAHEALFYRSPDQLASAIRDFAAEGNAADEPLLVVMPGENLELARNALADTEGDVRFVDMLEAGRNPSCLISLYEEWIEERDVPVRLLSEAIWPERSYTETVECLRHEALVNHALGPSSAHVLCPFDAEKLDADTLRGAEMTHPQIMEGDGRRRASDNFGDPAVTFAGAEWPQAAVAEPVSDLESFGDDLFGLRQAVANDPIAGPLDDDRTFDLVFAVNEAATNAIRHGDGEYTTRMWRDGDSVVSEVRTRSRIDDVMAGRRRPKLNGQGGRGLWLINQLCDLVELRTCDAGTSVRMHMTVA